MVSLIIILKMNFNFLTQYRLDTGSMGIGSVDFNFRGNRYGIKAIISLAKKIATDYDSDVHFEIVNGNRKVEKSAKEGGLEMIDTQSWILAKKKEKLLSAPMFGHL